MEDVLAWMSKQLEAIGVPYEFEQWTDIIKYPYFVGDYDESGAVNEDGMTDTIFRITGFTRHSWSELYGFDKKIKELFPRIEGKRAVLPDGSGITAFYNSSQPTPTSEEDLKKLEIRVEIKFWKVGN